MQWKELDSDILHHSPENNLQIIELTVHQSESFCALRFYWSSLWYHKSHSVTEVDNTDKYYTILNYQGLLYEPQNGLYILQVAWRTIGF
jgi:hypothetical protein